MVQDRDNKAASDRQQYVQWFQVCTWHDRSYIAQIPLPPHGLTVKHSPCPCSHSILTGRIAACPCGHSKCNLLLTQACPRMTFSIFLVACNVRDILATVNHLLLPNWPYVTTVKLPAPKSRMSKANVHTRVLIPSPHILWQKYMKHHFHTQVNRSLKPRLMPKTERSSVYHDNVV